MRELDETQKKILAEVADLHQIPVGAFNIRANGESAGRNSRIRFFINQYLLRFLPEADPALPDG